MKESLGRWRRMWADPTPRIERHTCPTCGCRFTWHIVPPPPDEIPDDLPVVDALHPIECTDCLVLRARKAPHEPLSCAIREGIEAPKDNCPAD